MGSDDARWKHVVRLARHSPRYEPFRLWAGLMVELDNELDALRERAERAERERDAIIEMCVRKGGMNRGLWWDLVGITGQTEPFNQVRVAAGLAAAPADEGIGCSSEWFCRGHPKEYCPCRDRLWAADPETLDRPRSGASEGDPPRQDAQEGPWLAPGRADGG